MSSHGKSHQDQDKDWKEIFWCSFAYLYLLVASLLIGFAYHDAIISNPWVLIAFLAFSAVVLLGFIILKPCDGDRRRRSGRERGRSSGSHGHPGHHHRGHPERHHHGHPEQHHDGHPEHHHHGHPEQHHHGHPVHHNLDQNGSRRPSHQSYEDQHSHSGDSLDSVYYHGPHYHPEGESWKDWIAEKWADVKEWFENIGHRDDDDDDDADQRVGQQGAYRGQPYGGAPSNGPRSRSRQAGVSDPDKCRKEIIITAIVCSVLTIAVFALVMVFSEQLQGAYEKLLHRQGSGSHSSQSS